MKVRVKVVEYYEFDTAFSSIKNVKDMMEAMPTDSWWKCGAAYVGRDVYIEDAERHGNLHSYTQVDC